MASMMAANHSHCLLSKFAISEPDTSKPKRNPNAWGDMFVQQSCELLPRGAQYDFRFLKELLLTPNGDYAYSCYVKALEQVAVYLDRAAQSYMKTHSITPDNIRDKAPNGRLLAQVRVFVPLHKEIKVPTELLLFVNNEDKSCHETRAIEATGPQMLVQLAHAILLLVKEARGDLNTDVAMPPAMGGKLIK